MAVQDTGNHTLEDAMDRASQGEPEAAAAFYRAFLAGPLFIPERYQSYSLSDSPEYPNNFINLLGVQDNERVVIPAFSHKQYIKEWCGADLAFKQMKGSALLEAVPKGWWLVINPGRLVEKDLSPWEQEQLRAGEEGVAAVVAELKEAESSASVSVHPLQPEEHASLKAAIRSSGEAHSEIKKLYLLREEIEEEGGEKTQRLILGAEAPGTTAEARERLHEELQKTAAPHLIGGEPLQIVVEEDGASSVMLGIFKNSAALYERVEAQPWWRRFLRLSKG